MKFNFFKCKQAKKRDTSELLEQYRQYLRARAYSELTIRTYEGSVKKFLAEFPNPTKLRQEEIEGYFGNFKSSLSRLRGVFYAISSFFEFLIIHKRDRIRLDRYFLKSLTPIHYSKTVPRIIPDDELNALFRQIKDLKTLRRCRDYAIMLFLLHGLRAQEICSLNIDDVYIDGRGVTRKMVIRVRGKGNKERIIVVETSGDTEWAWQRYLQMRSSINSNVAFPGLLGKGQSKRLTTNGLYHILSRYAAKAGVRNFHPHLWRHTTATRLLEKGVPLKEIQHRLGHASLGTTEKYLSGASILQDESAHCDWINNLKKPDAKYRRWR